MSFLEWSEDFSIGIPAVDHEHQDLILLINELHTSLIQDHTSDRTQEFLGELFARIAAHFALEEKLMRDFVYDQYYQHKADHETLLDDLRDMMDAARDNAYDEHKLSTQLEQWFSVHFQNHDARLHHHMQG